MRTINCDEEYARPSYAKKADEGTNLLNEDAVGLLNFGSTEVI